MSPVKLPYYPKVQATMHVTRFGAVEISESRIYNTPIPGKVILRVDCLDCLRDKFGDDCFICRELFYTILSGEHPIYNANEILASYYRKYKTFTDYVNDRYFYGDASIPLLERCALPLRERVDAYKNEMMQYLSDMGGKFLIQTCDFLYYAFNSTARIPEVKGAKVIC